MSQFGVGAPLGNRNAAKEKPWVQALRTALLQYEGGDIKAGQALRHIADTVVLKAIKGDKDAIQEIGNRLDGKPAQSVTIGGDDEAPVVVKGELRLVRADPSG